MADTVTTSKRITFDEDGEAVVDLYQGGAYMIGGAGDFDGGKLTFSFLDGAGGEIPVPEPGNTDGGGSPYEAKDAFIFSLWALTAQLKIELSGATGPDLAVTVAAARQ